MIVIKAKTIEQWHAILDYYFAKGYTWEYFSRSYCDFNFKRGRQLIFEDDKSISWATGGMFKETTTYDEIMMKKKRGNKS